MASQDISAPAPDGKRAVRLDGIKVPQGDVELTPEEKIRGEMAAAGVKVEPTPEERIRRQMVEAERLANLSPGEWKLWVDGSAEKLGIPTERLAATVKEILAKREKELRTAKVEAQRKGTQKSRRIEKEKVETKRERIRAEKGTKRKEEKEEKAKAREKEKVFKTLVRLPSREQDARITNLATRLGEDVETLRAEFEVFAGSKRDDTGYIEPWPEPVDAHALLIELKAQLRRYVVMDDNAALAISLWVLFSWIHDVAMHSPILGITSTDPDCGKSTLLGVIGYVTPRSYPVVEITGASLFHLVDQHHPTLLIDEADQLFHRKPDLRHIVNAGWTRGTKITRIVHGFPYAFDPYCPKVVALMGMNMPVTVASRAIVVKLWPKTSDEKVEDFVFNDDATFEALRRKLVRWSSDNLSKLKDAQPAFPAGFDNRLGANWKLLFAIAEHAGVLEEAHRAAVKLSPRTTYKRSDGVRLLVALREVFGTRKEMASAEICDRLKADPDSEWGAYRERGPITQRQVAALLAEYGIYPDTLHPTKRSDLSLRGYRREQFNDAFARFLPPDPHIRTQQ